MNRTACMLGLEALLSRLPRKLSGGQRQRVAMCRAIVRAPRVFLFDEPFSNLDAKLRVQMRSEIKGSSPAPGGTSIYVTHDQVEAMTMADRIVVMNRGAIERVRFLIWQDRITKGQVVMQRDSAQGWPIGDKTGRKRWVLSGNIQYAGIERAPHHKLWYLGVEQNRFKKGARSCRFYRFPPTRPQWITRSLLRRFHGSRNLEKIVEGFTVSTAALLASGLAGTDFERFERQASALSREVLGGLLKFGIEQLDDGTGSLTGNGKNFTRVEATSHTVMTSAGPATYSRSRSRRAGEASIVPVDEKPGLAAGYFTPLAARQALFLMSHNHGPGLRVAVRRTWRRGGVGEQPSAADHGGGGAMGVERRAGARGDPRERGDSRRGRRRLHIARWGHGADAAGREGRQENPLPGSVLWHRVLL